MARPRKSQGLGIPYYAVRGARAFWEPRGAIPAGFEARPLGPAGTAAEDRATGLYRRMAAAKRGGDPSALRASGIFPKGSIGAGYFRYRATSVWRDKEPRTREEWERVWARLGPIFGDVDPKTVSLEMLSEWRDQIEQNVSLTEAHRAIKIWRALWNVLDGFKLTDGQRDPSKSIPNHAPPPRSQVWRECEIACIAKRAWRDGYTGLATILVILWDGMMSPVDARTVKASQIITDGTGRALELVRAKSGQKAIAPLTHRAWRVITAYRLGRLEPDDSPMCRTREGSEYSKDVLSKDFRTIRQRVFPGDGRTMLDIRRTGASEAVAGTGDMKALSDAMGNSLSQNQALQKAYTPAQMATAMTIPEARRRGRREISKNKN